MATNPEGSREPGRTNEDEPGPRFTAVVVPDAPADVLDAPSLEDDLAEEYEAALEGHTPPPSVDIDFGRPPTEEVDLDGQPTSVEGQPADEPEQDTVQRAPAGKPRRRPVAEAGKRDQLFGQVLADRYRILDLIGKGGMGKVYLAEHVALGKKVAVKVLNPAYTNRPDQVQRFLREARAASKIGHENVIDITDFGEMPNGQVFFAMEHLQGEDLGKLLKKSGPMPWSRARRVMLQICRALQAAHSRGIIHRDMKPENCFLIHRNGIRDFVKVLDFGIAKSFEENREGGSNPLTQIGALIGTPEYMAPEQIHGDTADLRMDIYAVGCILYQLLTGNLPFTDKTMYGVLSQQVNAKPIPPRQLAPEADIPPEVEAIVLKAMEKDKNLRYQTMGELIEAIVAAPRGAVGASDGRMTTTNLEAAASAARVAAGMGTASVPIVAGVNPVTPPDDSLLAGANGVLQSGVLNHSSSGLTPTTVSPPWRGAMDPRMLTRLVIGLGAAVLVLVIGLVCALNRGDEVKPQPVDPPGEVAEVAPNVPPPTDAPDVKVPETPPQPPPETKVAPDDETIIVDEGDTKVTPPTPTPKDPGKKVEVKKPRDPVVKKTDPAPKTEDTSSWPEVLGPMERSAALKNYRADFDTCRTISTPKGKTYKLRLKVDGPKGKVIEATPDDASAEVKCLARVFKNKVRFVNTRKSVQEFPIVVSL